MILNKIQAAWIPRDIENLETKGLSGAAIAALKSVNIQTVGNLLDWKITELFSIPNFGVVMTTEVFAALRACSFQVPKIGRSLQSGKSCIGMTLPSIMSRATFRIHRTDLHGTDDNATIRPSAYASQPLDHGPIEAISANVCTDYPYHVSMILWLRGVKNLF
jgi:hypothetical protein